MTGRPASPLDVVQAFNAAMERMDYDTALMHVADDLEYINGPNPPARRPLGWIVYWRDYFDKQTVVGGMSRLMGSSR
ncbi:MAG: hypothetical protein KF911_01110 [Pseudomonadales bacterium]|nr:hypothetical protein [Pseudomonadales bacterium]